MYPGDVDCWLEQVVLLLRVQGGESYWSLVLCSSDTIQLLWLSIQLCHPLVSSIENTYGNHSYFRKGS